MYPVDLDMKNDDQLDQYYDRLIETWENYTPVDDEATAEEISQELLHISQVMYDTARAVTKKPRTKTKKRKDGWSPAYIAMKAQLTALTEIRRCLQGEKHRPKWHNTYVSVGIRREIDKWECMVRAMKGEEPDETERLLNIIPNHGPSYWRTLPAMQTPAMVKLCDEDMTKLLSLMHGRQRSELRSSISAATALRERLLQEGKLGRVIKSVLGTETNKFNYDSLHTREGIVTDPVEIHNEVAGHFQQWFSGDEPLTGIHAPENDWRTILTDKDSFFKHAKARADPEDITNVIWQSLQAPTLTPAYSNVKAKLSRELTEAPTLDELISAIHQSPSGSAAGITGVSYNMLKTAPDDVLKEIHRLLVKLAVGIEAHTRLVAMAYAGSHTEST